MIVRSPDRRLSLVRVVVGIAAVGAAAACGLFDPGPPPPDSSTLDGIPERRAAWSVTPPEAYGDVRAAQAVGDAVVVAYESRVQVLDRESGDPRWDQPADIAGNHEPQPVTVTPGTVVVRDAGSTETRVYDLGTGEERFSQPYDAVEERVAVTYDVVITVACSGGPCTVTAVDLDSGQRRWRRAYDDVPRLAAGPETLDSPGSRGDDPANDSPRDRLLAPRTRLVAVTGIAAGDLHDTTTFVDATTGRNAAPPVRVGHNDDAALLSETVYAVSLPRTQETCAGRIGGYELASQRELWTIDVGTWHPDSYRLACQDETIRLAGRRLLTYTPEEEPMLVAAGTGEPAWTGRPGQHPIGYDGGIVVVRERHARGDLAAIDVGTGDRLWSTTPPWGPYEGVPGASAVAGGHLILSSEVTGGDTHRQVLWTYQLRTGERRICAGSNRPYGVGDGWLVAGTGEREGRVELRYFAL